MTDGAPGSPQQHLPTGAALKWPAALLWAIRNKPIDFYPRLIEGGVFKTRDDRTLIKEHVDAAEDWDAIKDDPGLDKVIELARASLNEAKAQTEYQDQKATRLLTVTTFLSALSAGLYAAFNTAHPIGAIYANGCVAALVQILTHLAFLAFVLAVLGGMLITFHATRAQFKYPDTATVERQDASTRSFLFFREMVGVTPAAWANSFVTPAADEGGKPTLRPDLKVEYLKNYVGEAYLIAAKTADKLRFLEPAQSLLAWALRCLLLFVALFALVNAIWQGSSAKPTQVQGPNGGAIPVKVVK
jgi:hypothetical protein